MLLFFGFYLSLIIVYLPKYAWLQQQQQQPQGLSSSSSGQHHSNCYKTLSNLISVFHLTQDTFVPQCDENGNYKPMQCQSVSGECWCVDVVAGIEINNTRRSTTTIGQTNINCSQIVSQHAPLLSTTHKPTATLQTPGVIDDNNKPYIHKDCLAAKHAGDINCSHPANPGIRFYFDIPRFTCLAFMFSGCGGGDTPNNFKSTGACMTHCLPMDYGSCSGDAPSWPGQFENGKDCRADGNHCPDGYVCMMGAFFASCCNASIESIYKDSYSPKCKNGAVVQPNNFDEFKIPLLGANCQDLKCEQLGRTCESNQLFSYCCEVKGQLKTVVDNRCSTVPPPRESAVRAVTVQYLWYYNQNRSECEEIAFYGVPKRELYFQTQHECHNSCNHKNTIKTDNRNTTFLLNNDKSSMTSSNNSSSMTSSKNSSTAMTSPNNSSTVMTSSSSGAMTSSSSLCDLPRDYGLICNVQLDLFQLVFRWYFDRKRQVCLSFTFNGCGGNANNFLSWADCAQRCRTVPDVHCPTGHRCFTTTMTETKQQQQQHLSGAISSHCCNVTFERYYQLAIGHKCSNDSTEAKDAQGDVLLGASCDDLICPENYDCVALPMFAKCCLSAAGSENDDNEATFIDRDSIAITEKIGECNQTTTNQPIAGEYCLNLFKNVNQKVSLEIKQANDDNSFATGKWSHLLSIFLDNLLAYCQAFLVFNDCVADVPILNACSTSPKVSFGALIDRWSSICSEQSLSVFLSNRNCVENVTKSLEFLHSCGEEDSTDDWNNSLDCLNYTRCIVPQILFQCGHPVANLSGLLLTAGINFFTNNSCDRNSEASENVWSNHDQTLLPFMPQNLSMVNNKELSDYKRLNGQRTSSKKCIVHREKVLSDPNLTSVYVPQCSVNGNYLRVQCHASDGSCWCADPETGVPIAGSRVQHNMQPLCSDCERARAAQLTSSSSPDWLPECTAIGSYRALQCSTNQSDCWCVDSQNGAELNGTRTHSSSRLGKMPNCSTALMPQSPVAAASSCDRQSSTLLICDSILSPPKQLVRWFAEDGLCKRYIYTWCPGQQLQQVDEQQPITNKEDCERVCL